MSLPAPFSRDARATLVVAAVGVAAIIPIFIWGIPVGADLVNHYRFALSFHDSILGGNLYPGWLAYTNDGYGDPRLRFYPPGLYYVLSAARALSGWYSATILTFCLLSIVGGLGVYFLCRSLCSTKVAMWAGIIYTIAPYHLNQLYRSSVLAEYAACAVLPFAFAFVDRLCRKGRTSDIGGLSLAYALLILVHLPLTVIGSLSLLVYGALRIKREMLWQTLLKLGLAVLLALAASCFFWTTIVAELSWIKGSSVNPNINFDYRMNFLFSPWALTNFSNWHGNLIGLATIGLLLPALVLFKRVFFAKQSDTDERTTALRTIFLLVVISFLMATDLSRPAWAIIPKLRETQFPWRWLGITSMFGSILLAASIPDWVERVKAGFRPRYVFIASGLALSLLFIATQVIWDAEYLRGQAFVAKFPIAARGSVSFELWLPVWAKEVTQLKKMTNDVEAGARVVTITSWEPEHRTFRIGSGPATEARVRTYYYPHWIATSQGKSLGIRPSDDGALLITVPPEETNVELEFREPRRVAIARFVSGFGWILIAVLFVFAPARRLILRLRRRQSLIGA